MKIIKFFLLITVFNSCFEQKTNIEEKDLIPIWSQNTDLVGVPSTAPLIIDNELVVYSGEISLTALRIDDGEVIWRGAIDEKNSIQSNQLLYDGEKIVSNHIHDVIAWDKRTGEKVFFKGKSDGISVFKIGKNSITDEGYAFVGDTLDLYVLNKIGDIIYTKDIELSTAGVGYVNGKLFLGQRKTINGALTIGRIIALDAQSGDSLWGFETNNGGFSWIPPIIEEGVVYAGTYLGNPSRVFALDAENGEMIWERPGFSTYQMITNEHRIYVNTQGSLQAIEKSNGEIAWSSLSRRVCVSCSEQ